jgi:hypothetical protein
LIVRPLEREAAHIPPFEVEHLGAVVDDIEGPHRVRAARGGPADVAKLTGAVAFPTDSAEERAIRIEVPQLVAPAVGDDHPTVAEHLGALYTKELSGDIVRGAPDLEYEVAVGHRDRGNAIGRTVLDDRDARAVAKRGRRLPDRGVVACHGCKECKEWKQTSTHGHLLSWMLPTPATLG